MEITIAQRLDGLLHLQKIDSELDELNKVRGDLPEEVRDLEDELAGYDTRIGKFNNEVDAVESDIAGQKANIKESEKLIKKYEDQQMNVRNSREYDAITKEIEAQRLDIQIFEKKIKEAQYRIEKKQDEINLIKGTVDERKKDLTNKKEELEHILAESRDDEAKLMEERVASEKHVEERLLFSYNRIRNNSRNGLAVVAVKRGACGGCYNQVPLQRQADIRERKKLIVCEHCGRILAEVETGELEMVAAAVAAGKKV